MMKTLLTYYCNSVKGPGKSISSHTIWITLKKSCCAKGKDLHFTRSYEWN